MACGSTRRTSITAQLPTLADVVATYNARQSLGLTDAEMSDLVEYLKSL